MPVNQKKSIFSLHIARTELLISAFESLSHSLISMSEVTRREGELRVIVRRHGGVAAKVAKDKYILLAWKIEVSTAILSGKV